MGSHLSDRGVASGSFHLALASCRRLPLPSLGIKGVSEDSVLFPSILGQGNSRPDLAIGRREVVEIPSFGGFCGALAAKIARGAARTTYTSPGAGRVGVSPRANKVGQSSRHLALPCSEDKETSLHDLAYHQIISVSAHSQERQKAPVMPWLTKLAFFPGLLFGCSESQGLPVPSSASPGLPGPSSVPPSRLEEPHLTQVLGKLLLVGPTMYVAAQPGLARPEKQKPPGAWCYCCFFWRPNIHLSDLRQYEDGRQ